MNSIRNKLGVLIVTAFVVAITGCGQTIKNITRENHSVDHLSKADAAKELQGHYVYVHDTKFGGIIGSVGETSFGYCEVITIEDSRRLVSEGTIGSTTTRRYAVSYHNECRRSGTMSFAEITKIVQRTNIINTVIDLYGKSGRICIIQRRTSLEKFEKVLSALLMLCPNVE